MYFDYDGVPLYAEFLQEGTLAPPLMLVHGFAGTLEDWRPLAGALEPGRTIAALDIPGFGKSGVPHGGFYTAGALATIQRRAIEALGLEEYILVGYSMGGRAALHYAVQQPAGLKGLALLSASAGIASAEERERRKASDEELISYIEQHSTKEFAKKWLALPLFSGLHRLPERQFLQVEKRKTEVTKEGLINSLRGFGQGVMPPLHDVLKDVKAPVLLLSGEEDKKYCSLNAEMKELFADALHIILPGATHSLHLEKPDAVAAAIKTFIEHVSQTNG